MARKYLDSNMLSRFLGLLQNWVTTNFYSKSAQHTHGNSDITGIDASKITSGTVDVARLPAGTMDTLYKVQDQNARFALTAAQVQTGDSVQQLDNNRLYLVVDESKLDSEDGYVEYAAGTDWSTINNKPTEFTPSSHTHAGSDITSSVANADSAAACTGNAVTATTATNANNAKLTRTNSTTEYPMVFGSSWSTSDTNQALRINSITSTQANNSLRVCPGDNKAANTEGNAYIVIGNNLAKTAANNRTGSIYLYGSSSGHTNIRPGNNTTSNVTVTLPSSTGTIALTSSDITGSSASCTGNAATATTATTATNANNIKTTSTDAAWKDIVGVTTGFTSGSNYAACSHNSGSVSFYVDKNATSGNQRGILRLGNSTANTTAAGHSGQIYMYGTSTGYTIITPGYNSTSNITLTLPAATGTIALTSSNITGSSASCTGNAATATTASACSGNSATATTATKWNGYSISVVTALPSSPNANTIYFIK